MPTVVETPTGTIVWYRQPWFWAVAIAVVAILVFGIVIAASGPPKAPDSTNTIIQQPVPSQPNPSVTPVPVPSATVPPSTITPAPAASTVPPMPPQPPAPAITPPPAKTTAPPKVIHEKVVVRERVPVPVPVPVGPDTFQTTGLPKEVHFSDSDWKAARIMDVTPDKLKEAGTAEDGQQLMVSINAEEPFTTVLAAVPGQDGKYVEYRKQ